MLLLSQSLDGPYSRGFGCTAAPLPCKMPLDTNQVWSPTRKRAWPGCMRRRLSALPRLEGQWDRRHSSRLVVVHAPVHLRELGLEPVQLSACTPSYHTPYLFCIPPLLAALSTFRAELPAERGTRLRRAVQDPACAPCRVSCVSPSSGPSPSTNRAFARTCAYRVCPCASMATRRYIGARSTTQAHKGYASSSKRWRRMAPKPA